MSTRCMIGRKVGDQIIAFYCHQDGDQNGVGRILVDYYNGPIKRDHLFRATERRPVRNLGRQNWDTVFENYYNEPTTYENEETCSHEAYDQFGAEYFYLFKDEKWFMTSIYGPHNFIELTKKWIRHLTKADVQNAAESEFSFLSGQANDPMED